LYDESRQSVTQPISPGRLYGLFWSLGASVTEAIVRSLTTAGDSTVNREALGSTREP
jgi:hypothetical protein